jgi:hypothetical protein
VHLISADIPFPGLAALDPCLGAALVILAGMNGPSLGGRALAVRPVVFVGLISYSLYLWHWPLLVLQRSHLARDELTTVESLMVLALSVALAAASWWWIERPFRGARPLLARRPLFATAGVATAAILAVGLTFHFGNGLASRLPPHALLLAAGAADRSTDRGDCLELPPDAVRNGDLCALGAALPGSASFVLWGDSHAEALRGVVGDVAASAGRKGLFAGRPGCPPLVGTRVTFRFGAHKADSADCAAYNAAVLDLVRHEPGIGTVVLAGQWSLYATGTPYAARADLGVSLEDLTAADPSQPATNEAVFRHGLSEAVRLLVEAGKRVVLIGPVPEVAAPVPWTLALAAWHDRHIDLRPARSDFALRNATALGLLGEFEERGLATVLYPDAILCDAERCRVVEDGRPLYADDNHLTRVGAAMLEPLFRTSLRGGSVCLVRNGAMAPC